jgi:hypothetical protein
MKINSQLVRSDSKIKKHAYGFQCVSKYRVFQDGQWRNHTEFQLGTSDFAAQSNCDRQANTLTDESSAREASDMAAHWAAVYADQFSEFLAAKKAGINPFKTSSTDWGKNTHIVYVSLGKVSFETYVKAVSDDDAIAQVESQILARGAK